MGDLPTMRIVTLGKTGSGKSSLVNTLSGEKQCTVNPLANSETQHCQPVNKVINGIQTQLIDTPGFFDTNQNSTTLKDELNRCIVTCAPGPHAFLLVLKVERFTSQEEAVVEQMLDLFSEEALKFTTVVFTHGDQLPEGMEIKEWVSVNDALKNLVQKCGGRCHVFDNKYWNNSNDQYRNNQHQIKQLLQTISQSIEESQGECYTNEMLMKVQMMKELEKQRLKQISPGISEEQLYQKVIESVIINLKKHWKRVTVGAILGALLGGVAIGALAATLGAPVYGICAAAGLGGLGLAVLGGAVGGIEWTAVCKAMANQARMLRNRVINPSMSEEELVKLMKSD